MHCVSVVGEDPSTLCDNGNWTEQETDRLFKRNGMEGTVLGGLEPISVSSPITLTLCNGNECIAWCLAVLTPLPCLLCSPFLCLLCFTPQCFLNLQYESLCGCHHFVSVVQHFAMFLSSFRHWTFNLRWWTLILSSSFEQIWKALLITSFGFQIEH